MQWTCYFGFGKTRCHICYISVVFLLNVTIWHNNSLVSYFASCTMRANLTNAESPAWFAALVSSWVFRAQAIACLSQLPICAQYYGFYEKSLIRSWITNNINWDILTTKQLKRIITTYKVWKNKLYWKRKLGGNYKRLLFTDLWIAAHNVPYKVRDCAVPPDHLRYETSFSRHYNIPISISHILYITYIARFTGCVLSWLRNCVCTKTNASAV